MIWVEWLMKYTDVQSNESFKPGRANYDSVLQKTRLG